MAAFLLSLGARSASSKRLALSDFDSADSRKYFRETVYLRESILDPGARVPKGFEGLGVGMPSYLGILKDWQIEALILYIESVRK